MKRITEICHPPIFVELDSLCQGSPPGRGLHVPDGLHRGGVYVTAAQAYNENDSSPDPQLSLLGLCWGGKQTDANETCLKAKNQCGAGQLRICLKIVLSFNKQWVPFQWLKLRRETGFNDRVFFDGTTTASCQPVMEIAIVRSDNVAPSSIQKYLNYIE